jgi:hypothetical protein
MEVSKAINGKLYRHLYRKFQIHLCGVYISDIIRQDRVYIGSITGSSRGIYTTIIMGNYTGVCIDNILDSYGGTCVAIGCQLFGCLLEPVNRIFSRCLYRVINIECLGHFWLILEWLIGSRRNLLQNHCLCMSNLPQPQQRRWVALVFTMWVITPLQDRIISKNLWSSIARLDITNFFLWGYL